MNQLRTILGWASLAMLGMAPLAHADPAAQGVVTVAYEAVAQGVHPVLILDVDGKPQPTPLRDVLYLAPGKHSFRLGAKLDERAGAIRGRIHGDSKAATLEIEVEAGKRYVIGAKLEGRDAASWRPVVHRVEELRAADGA